MALVENLKQSPPQSAAMVLKSAGYGTSLQNSPKRVLESPGVKEALKQYDFSVERADAVIAEILEEGEEVNRVKAAQEIYKRTGAYAPTKAVNVTLEVDVKAEVELEQLANKLGLAISETYAERGLQKNTGSAGTGEGEPEEG